MYRLHAPSLPHPGNQSNITQLLNFLISGCRGPITTMPCAYIYVYTSNNPTSIRFLSCAKSSLHQNKSIQFKWSVFRESVQYNATPPYTLRTAQWSGQIVSLTLTLERASIRNLSQYYIIMFNVAILYYPTSNTWRSIFLHLNTIILLQQIQRALLLRI
jgi:hypothetical protein